MSLVKDVLKSLVEKGVVEHEKTIQGIKFTFRPLSTEDLLLAESISSASALKKKYSSSDEIQIYNDTISKFRNVSTLAFSIVKINGVAPVDEKLTLEKQLTQRVEFRDELMSLSPELIDLLTDEYRQLSKKQISFYDDVEGNVGK